MQIEKRRLQMAPVAALGIGLLVAIVLALLPRAWIGPVRGGAARLLRPGQIGALGLRQRADQATTRIRSHFHAAGRLAEAEEKLQRVRRDNERLAAELAALRTQPSVATDESTDAAAGQLLLARCVPARVLGRQARAFLRRHQLLDVGSEEGVEPDALVVEALIDRGDDANLKTGHLVLSGRRVWGKIMDLGTHTSTVCGLTEPGFRDVVRLGSPSGPQGILEGTGRPLCRVRLVEVTQPVAVGDPVYTTAAQGVLPAPPLYGRIVRLERPTGAAHWEIWMQPAVTRQPQRVAVLRVELNPVRVSEKGDGSQSMRRNEFGVR